MQKKSLFAILLALLITASQIVVAQHGPRSGPRHAPAAQAPTRPAYRPPRNTRPDDYDHYRFAEHRRSPHGVLRPGRTVPRYYRHRQYIIDDWRAHYLYAPPRGYRWIYADGDYLLVAVASHIIARILIGTQ